MLRFLNVLNDIGYLEGREVEWIKQCGKSGSSSVVIPLLSGHCLHSAFCSNEFLVVGQRDDGLVALCLRVFFFNVKILVREN